MGSYDSGGGSPGSRGEDDEEEYEESGGGNRLLGFMFGNVDDSGDLDADYLDEDAKENLAAVADKLGSSLTDIELSVRSPDSSADAAEQDYNRKAETAVDYQDIDEDYDGPEIQTANEEDHLLPKNEYFSSIISFAATERRASVFDDENYDEDEEEKVEKEHTLIDKELEVETTSSSAQQHLTVLSGDDEVLGDHIPQDTADAASLNPEVVVMHEEEVNARDRTQDDKHSAPLPILCIEEGSVILRFSEIFGIHEPLKKDEKRDLRYSVYKEKYTSLKVSDIVEEDEEIFFKGSGKVFQLPSSVVQYDIPVSNDDGLVSSGFGVAGSVNEMTVQDREIRKSSFPSAKPMNMDLTLNFSREWQSPSISKFYPLDQLDWEEGILWDDSPAISEISVKSRDMCEIDAEDEVISGTGSGDVSGANMNSLELPVAIDEKDQNFLRSYNVFLESFGSGDSFLNGFRESRFHPQLLRLESLLELDNNNENEADGNRDKELQLSRNDVMRRLSKLDLQNGDMVEGSWLDDVIWEQHEAHLKPKLILDLQDEQMLFELLDHKDSEYLQLHAGAMIMTRPQKARVSPDLPGHGFRSGWQFNIANDKYYMSRKVSQQLQSTSNKHTALGVKVHHSAPAIKLQTMKLKLSNKDLANFHRPKALWYPHDNEVAVKEQGKLPTAGPMKIILKSLGGKGSKLHVDSEENVSSIKEKASKKLDFKPSESVKIFYLGKELEDNKSLAAQNVHPNSLLHLVRTKIYLWPRAQRIPGENKSLRPPGAFKKKSDLSVKDGHIFLMEYCEERPLLLSNVGMGANLRTYYQKANPNDQTGTFLRNGNQTLGNVVTLEPNDKSPFLGDIKAGSSQSSLETHMYRAPVFSHKVPTSDFLLVRSAKGKLSIRCIDKIAVVGQQEPITEVLSPFSKNLQTYLTNRLLVHVYREFRAAEKRGMVPWIRSDELQAQFPVIPDTILKKKLKECAAWKGGAHGHWFWSKKRDFTIPSEEELKKMVLPEHVCAYESMQAGLYHLKHLGITRLTLPGSISTAMSQLPDEAIALAAASHVERELQITPWNLSSNFVACRNQDRETIERLEITGVGDPSGRGLGFSYVRAAPKASMSNAISKKKTAAGRGGTTVTGTDADLRRLSMEAAREVLLKFNVPDEQIAKQTRWHRIAMIRKLSSEQPATGVQVDPTAFSKYARSQRMSFLQLQQQAREKCQEIWDRLVQSLSSLDSDEIESDSEAHSDLDSFAGDLENLLDAEENEGNENNKEAKNDKADGIKGLKMRRHPSQAQAAEEIEDEAAEAAELCRLLMDDNETEQKKKKPKPDGVESRLMHSSKSNFTGNTEKVKKYNKAQPIGSYPPEEDGISDSKEVETFFNKKKLPEKLKSTKENGTSVVPQVKTKVKILGDGLENPAYKEKKSAREVFQCSACKQYGHMKTNKNCPKYGEEPDTVVEVADSEIVSGKSESLDPSKKPLKDFLKKKPVRMKTKKPEGEKSSMKVPVKFKCGSTEPFTDVPVDGAAKGSDQSANSDVGATDVPVSKVKKIKISTKTKSDDVQESLRPAITIQTPSDVDRSQNETPRLSLVMRTPTSADRDHVESHRPSVVIVPPAEKKQPQKKLVIKQRKEIVDVDQDGTISFENRKTRRMVELSGLVSHGGNRSVDFVGDLGKKNAKVERMWLEEEEKGRSGDRLRRERGRRVYDDEMNFLDEGDEILELRKYEENIRKEREEEEKQKAKKKKKKKPDFNVEFFEDFRTRTQKRMPERDRGVKRRPVSELGRSDYGPIMKRRRGGEVALANTLEIIVDALRSNTTVSYLFLRPVTKKEAPDYYDIIKHPMDLSTIKTKVKKLEYKDREEFRHDVWQITFNAHRYNDKRNPGIPPLADQLLELCDYLLKEHEDSLDEAEGSIENLRE